MLIRFGVELVAQHRRSPLGAQVARTVRGQRDPGLVLEDEPRPAASRAFVIRGQASFTQRATSSSLRSRARRRGAAGSSPAQ
jgi:hypothetical protein